MTLYLQPYDWTSRKLRDMNEILCWCIARGSPEIKENEKVLVRIYGYPSICYLQLPKMVNHQYKVWTSTEVTLIQQYFSTTYGDNAPYCEYVEGKTLYYFQNKNTSKFIKMYFKSDSVKNHIVSYLRGSIQVPGIGGILCIPLETDDSMENVNLSMLAELKMGYSQWFKLDTNDVSVVKKDYSSEISVIDHEYIIYDRTKIIPLDPVETLQFRTHPGVLCMDIETRTDNYRAHPNPQIANNCVYMISCIYQRYNMPETLRRILLLLGESDPIFDNNGHEVEVRHFDTEFELIRGYESLVKELKPEIVTGYNIFGYDFWYMNVRLKRWLDNWSSSMSLLKGVIPKMYEKEWFSAAYQTNKINYPEIDGIIHFDMMVHVRREFKLPRYKLDIVAKEFLDEGKNDMPAEEMFRIYDIKDPILRRKEIARVGSYCIQDSVLVMRLFEKFSMWYNLVEQSNINDVPISYLTTRGQQIRVLNKIIREIRYRSIAGDNIIIDKAPQAKTYYAGAFVRVPRKGRYRNVLTWDFASLYPSILMSHNMCFTTTIKPTQNDNVPDDLAVTVEWTDTVTDKQLKAAMKKGNVIVEADEESDDEEEEETPAEATTVEKVHSFHHKFKFVKPDVYKGILPAIVEELVRKRKEVRDTLIPLKKRRIAEIVEELKKPNVLNVEILTKEKKALEVDVEILNARQLALKVTANSVYGFTGAVRKGMLPCIEVGTSITATGRRLIGKVYDYVLKTYPGSIDIYGDSVTGDTPILVKEDGRVLIKTIRDLGGKVWISYPGFKLEDDTATCKQYCQLEHEKHKYEVWTDKGWSTIRKVIRHKTNKTIYRVCAHTGVVDVTEDHSLLLQNGDTIKPQDCSNKKLLCNFPNVENPLVSGTTITKEKAYVYGFFLGDGSCGRYDCNSGIKYSWALNTNNINLANYLKDLCIKAYEKEFIVLDTLESSAVYKIVPHCGDIKSFVEEYRSIFYDNQKNKIIPYDILNASMEVKESFLAGYYAADGCRKDTETCGCHRADIKSQISAMNLFYFLKSMGYKVSINTRKDKMNIYRITYTKKGQRKDPCIVKKIYNLGQTTDYVYDLETENSHFHAGVGQLIVHNTDSCMFDLGIKDSKECQAIGERIAGEITAMFPPPVKMEFEKAFFVFITFTKKQYAGVLLDKKGNPLFDMHKIFIKGLPPVRRDFSDWLKDCFTKVLMVSLKGGSIKEAFNLIEDAVYGLYRREVSAAELAVTTAVGREYKSKTYPTALFKQHYAALGRPLATDDRVAYVVVDTGIPKDYKGNKMRLLEHFYEEQELGKEPLDYDYYLKKVLTKQIRKLLDTAFAGEIEKYNMKMHEWPSVREREGLVDYCSEYVESLQRLIRYKKGMQEALMSLVPKCDPPSCISTTELFRTRYPYLGGYRYNSFYTRPGYLIDPQMKDAIVNFGKSLKPKVPIIHIRQPGETPKAPPSVIPKVIIRRPVAVPVVIIRRPVEKFYVTLYETDSFNCIFVSKTLEEANSIIERERAQMDVRNVSTLLYNPNDLIFESVKINSDLELTMTTQDNKIYTAKLKWNEVHALFESNHEIH